MAILMGSGKHNDYPVDFLGSQVSVKPTLMNMVRTPESLDFQTESADAGLNNMKNKGPQISNIILSVKDT